MDKPHAASHSDSLTVKAGAVVTIPVILDCRSQVVEYTFTVVDGVSNGLDVELSCTLQDPSVSPVKPVELLPVQRVQDIFGSMRVNLELPRGAHAVLEFRLSNSFSWLRSKSLKYKISVLPEPDPADLAKAALEAALQVTVAAEAETARLDAAAELAATLQARAALELKEAEIVAEAAASAVVARREALAAAQAEAASASSAAEAARAAAAAAQGAVTAAAASPLLQQQQPTGPLADSAALPVAASGLEGPAVLQAAEVAAPPGGAAAEPAVVGQDQ